MVPGSRQINGGYTNPLGKCQQCFRQIDIDVGLDQAERVRPNQSQTFQFDIASPSRRQGQRDRDLSLRRDNRQGDITDLGTLGSGDQPFPTGVTNKTVEPVALFFPRFVGINEGIEGWETGIRSFPYEQSGLSALRHIPDSHPVFEGFAVAGKIR